MKRRKFLTIVGATATAIAVGSIAASTWRQSLKESAKTWYESLKDLESGPTGSLNPHTLQTLIATTKAILQNERISMSHYENFFRWRAENVKGYKQLYEKFTAAVDKVAKQKSDREFSQIDSVSQLQIINQVASVHPSSLPSQLETFRITLLEKDQWFFDKYVVREIFQLFARTDALILVGYESWRGQPRGLENYRRAPDKVMTQSVPLSNALGR